MRKPSTKAQRHLHLGLAGVWLLLVIPTLLWFRESVLWVAFMSLYANFVGHWSAYQAASPSDTPADASAQDGG